MASLYQRSGMAAVALSVAGFREVPRRERGDAEDGGRLLARVQPDPLRGPAPEMPPVGEELVRLDPVLRAEPELVHRQGEARLVGLEGVQVDRDPHGVRAVRAPLAVEEDV